MKLREPNEQKYCGWCGAQVTFKSEWMSECMGCGYQNYLTSFPCNSLIIRHEDKVMMVKRAVEPRKGAYDFPGGFTDMTDESMEDSMLREMTEELGITEKDIDKLTYLGSHKTFYEWHGVRLHNLCFFYYCGLKNGPSSIVLDKTENTELIWLAKKDFSKIDFAWEADKLMLEKYFAEAE